MNSLELRFTEKTLILEEILDKILQTGIGIERSTFFLRATADSSY